MQPDWSRERPRHFWDPGPRLLRALRGYQAAAARGAGLTRLRWKLSHRFWSIVAGAEIPITVQIGGGLLLPHPNGIVVHADTIIGTNCLLFQQVTLGTNGSSGAPVVGDFVDIGPGAKVLGPVRIGDGAIIGAMSLVLKDVAADAVAAGIPARETERTATQTRERLRASSRETARSD